MRTEEWTHEAAIGEAFGIGIAPERISNGFSSSGSIPQPVPVGVARISGRGRRSRLDTSKAFDVCDTWGAFGTAVSREDELGSMPVAWGLRSAEAVMKYTRCELRLRDPADDDPARVLPVHRSTVSCAAASRFILHRTMDGDGRERPIDCGGCGFAEVYLCGKGEGVPN